MTGSPYLPVQFRSVQPPSGTGKNRAVPSLRGGAGQGRAGHGRAGQDRTGQGRAGQGRAGRELKGHEV
eukprot:767492-Hanusia_phi.AAC.2